jgi:hypothetical protein
MGRNRNHQQGIHPIGQVQHHMEVLRMGGYQRSIFLFPTTKKNAMFSDILMTNVHLRTRITLILMTVTKMNHFFVPIAS